MDFQFVQTFSSYKYRNDDLEALCISKRKLEIRFIALCFGILSNKTLTTKSDGKLVSMEVFLFLFVCLFCGSRV
jgi:hypothetical protein